MKKFLDDISPDLVLVTDERVQVTQAVTIGGDPFFEGWFFGTTDYRIKGTQDDIGLWTAIVKGGTQYDIMLEGTPGVGEALLDLDNSRIICSSAVCLYMCYYDFCRNFKYFELGTEIQIPVVGMVNCGSDKIIYQRVIDLPTRFIAGRAIGENNAEDNVPFKIYNLTTGYYKSINILTGNREAQADFGDGIEFQPGDVQKLTIQTNTGNFVNPRVMLQVG